jgi:hypothetical protein
MSREPDLFPSQGRSNVPGKQTFHLEITAGSSAIASAWGKDLAVEDTDTGKITVTFPRSYRKLTGFRWGWKQLAGSGAVYFPVILTDNITTTGVLILETRTEAGVATDAVSGSILLLEFDVSLDVLTDGYSITVTTP